MANEKKTTTTTTVKTLKGKAPPISPMKSAEFYAEQANQANNANAKSTNSQTNQQSKQLLKRLGIAGAIVALLLGVLFSVEHFNKPEKPAPLPPLSSPLVIPDAPSIAENNQNQNQNQNQNSNQIQNLDAPNSIIPPEEIEQALNPDNSDNIAQVVADNENAKNNSTNLVENNQTPQPAVADSFGTLSEIPMPNQSENLNKNSIAADNNKMQQGGHTILKLNPQPQQNQQNQIQIKNNNTLANAPEKITPPKPSSERKFPTIQNQQSQPNKHNQQNFVAEETFSPPILGTNKTAPALPEQNNLPNTRIVSTQSQIQITSAEKSVIPENKFRIQAGVFDSKINPQSAENLYQKLVTAGIPAVLENRVQVGPFANKVQAEKARQKLKELGINNAVIVMPKN